jgi:hypothetical protein
MALQQFKGKQVAGLWVYPYLDKPAESWELTLVIQKGMMSERQQVPQDIGAPILGESVDARLIDEAGVTHEAVTKPAAGALPEAGGPGVFVNARFAFRPSEGAIGAIEVTLRNKTEKFTELVRATEERKRPFAEIGMLRRLLKWPCCLCRRCCVKTFDVPANRSGRQWDGTTLFETFEMNAIFGEGLCCRCRCCEYRQEIRGSFAIGGAPWILQLPRGPLGPTAWMEDGVPNWFGPGRHFRYGHRRDPGTGTDIYRPNRRDGCEYAGWDRPFVRGALPLAINLEFRGRIIDICTGKVKRSTTWQVNYHQP